MPDPSVPLWSANTEETTTPERDAVDELSVTEVVKVCCAGICALRFEFSIPSVCLHFFLIYFKI